MRKTENVSKLVKQIEKVEGNLINHWLGKVEVCNAILQRKRNKLINRLDKKIKSDDRLSDDEIQAFNSYIENTVMPTAYNYNDSLIRFS